MVRFAVCAGSEEIKKGGPGKWGLQQMLRKVLSSPAKRRHYLSLYSWDIIVTLDRLHPGQVLSPGTLR